MTEEFVTKILETEEGVAPFEEWYKSLKDTKTRYGNFVVGEIQGCG